MLQITDYALPSPDQWRMAIKAMRLPFKSGDKSDSLHQVFFTLIPEVLHTKIFDINGNKIESNNTIMTERPVSYAMRDTFELGKADANLLKKLTERGSEHRKVLRDLDVHLEIKAPLYFWKQLDTYKVGTVTNSESTMHTITKDEFTEDDFSIEPYKYEDEEIEWSGGLECMQTGRINLLNSLRAKYLKTKDKYYWQKIIEFLPESYNQTRGWKANYETLLTIYFQRRDHKLNEWHTFCDWLLDRVPYFRELVEVIECTIPV